MWRERDKDGAGLHLPEMFETFSLHPCNPAAVSRLLLLLPLLLLRVMKSQNSPSKLLCRAAGARSMEMK